LPKAKLVDATVLFADLLGYSRLGRTMDPLALSELMNKLYAAVTPAIERAGGVVDKFIGDSVMAHFGAFKRLKDGPARAVKAAQALQVATRAFRAKAGHSLQFCVGIATGPVAAGSLGSGRAARPTVIGTTANNAALLSMLRTPDGVMLDRATHDAVQRTVKTRPLAPLRYANFEIEVHQVTG